MLNLLKSYLYRLFKDRLIMLIAILIPVFALLTTLLLLIMAPILEEMGTPSPVDGRTIFLNSLSLTNNMGIAFPVFISLYLCKDYQYGTIRNQIISGHHRSEIYIVSLISAIIFGFGMIIFNSLINLGIGSLFGGYGAINSGHEFSFILSSLGLTLVLMITFTTFTHFITSTFKNVALTIIITLVSIMLLSTISLVTMIPELPKWLTFILEVIPSIQNTLLIGGVMATENAGMLSLKIILSNIVYITIIFTTGIIAYRKSEFK